MSTLPQSINYADPFTPVSSINININELRRRVEQSKYWKNTLLPLINSGHMKSILNNQFQYPHRIGLFAGLSCMFYCGFCGRNKSAAYERNTLDAGMELYKQLI